jgi:glycosidase
MKQLIILLLFFLFACKSNTQEADPVMESQEVTMDMPEWAKSANIYEVNIRQYTVEGTFNAFAEHLPRLKEMGVDILWLMPIYPISSTKRKGGLGSYYAVSDFTEVNPEFGTMDDMDKLIKQIHDLEMYVILDWVPNHTGWDHTWLKEHPDYYTKNKDGEITDPINTDTGESWGWTDVADLNYENQEMRKQMIEDMKMWVRDHDIDGFRCDVAGAVPADFWDQVAPALQKIKNVFMLAEAEEPAHRNSGNFHISYGWHFHHILNQIAKGEKDVSEIRKYDEERDERFKKGFDLMFTSNHDENSWNGTEFERLGDGHKAFAVLASTFEGAPLIYSGQEEPLKKRLAFFEKDTINFKNYEYAPFYKSLLELKDANEALWNGQFGGEPKIISESNEVIAFVREKNENQVVVVINLTDKKVNFSISGDSLKSGLSTKMGEPLALKPAVELTLGPWQYSVATN